MTRSAKRGSEVKHAGRGQSRFRAPTTLPVLVTAWCVALAVVWGGEFPRVIYSTGFESADGYNPAHDLRGQAGWVGEGSGGSGLVDDYFSGYGQQAYIGFNAPAPKDTLFNIWRPLGVASPAPGEAVIRFSVLMQVVNSANGQYDDFRWSAYNTASERLFSISFDNAAATIFYALDDDVGLRPANFAFRNDAVYWLDVWMNFGRNTWKAELNGVVIVDSQPLTTRGARLDLSDVDAVWALHTPGQPGDNYLLFDEYSLTAEAGQTIPPLLETVGVHPDGQFELFLHGERGLTYAVDVSADLRTWSPLGTNRLADGTWSFTDATAPQYAMSLYRAREVSP